MEHWIEQTVAHFSWPVLLLLIAVTFYALSQGADLLVEEAVTLSVRWDMPKVLVGATIVSLGTTLPEAAVSVLAALKGSPELALGNAVGSIICDTGLILGLAALIAPLPLDRTMVNRQGWLQLGAGVLLVVACLPFGALTTLFEAGGRLPQGLGLLFLLLLATYLWQSVRWSRSMNPTEALEDTEDVETAATVLVLLKLVGGMVLVIGASWVLIPAVREAALRLRIPPGIIAATLVAFGTSLPELVTAVTAALKRHGELAVGNVIGADILNVLFVAGASAAVTRGGLVATSHFFTMLFPAMLAVLIVFRIGIFVSGAALRRPFGLLLIGIYILVTILSYANRTAI
ncbi:Inner membrane protein YrbG [Candidatus Entotheonellaceae bacterium PAL068K]